MPDPPPNLQRRVLPYTKVLVQPASARGRVTRQGGFVFDVLSQTRRQHLDVSNLSWWDQPTLRVYTPCPEYHAAHSVVSGAAPAGAGDYPVPDTSRSQYPTVTWERVSGTASMMTCRPDGDPPVYHVKVLDDAPLGEAWVLATADLGAWGGDLGAKGAGDFGLNRGVAVTVGVGGSDRADTDTGLDAPDAGSPDRSAPGDVRVSAGGIWSVLLPAGGGAALEKRFPHRDDDGVAREWVRLYTFPDAAPAPWNGVSRWLVTFGIVGGRLCVSVGGRSFPAEAYAYAEADPRAAGGLKGLSLSPSAVRVSGRAGGGARWIGLRRLAWGVGTYQNVLSTGGVRPPDSLTLTPVGYVNPVGDAGLGAAAAQIAPGAVLYTGQVRGTADGRETAALKWVWGQWPRTAPDGEAGFRDYGGALKSFEEEMAEPDFSGVRGTRGSEGVVNLIFDLQALDFLAHENGWDWRADLSPYAPVTFVLGQVRADADGGNETEVEHTRLAGYLWENGDDAKGFGDGEVSRQLRDQSVRLKEPGGFIDPSFGVLDLVLEPAAGTTQIYGWQGVQYILGKVIGDSAASTLRVYLPPDWYGLAEALTEPADTGKLPATDLPLLVPPYGKYAAEWIRQLAEMDYAALYPAGGVWVYGHFDRIVAGTPTWDVYDGSYAGGGPPPDAQIAFAAHSARLVFRPQSDFNRFVVWGGPPGGEGGDATSLGAPLVTADIRDAASIAASWERTYLASGGRFYDLASAQQLARKLLRMVGGRKQATGVEIRFDFALPEVYWGHKFTLHGFADLKDAQGVSLDGRTFRVLKLNHTGDLTAPRVACTVTLIEMPEGG